MIIGSLPSPNLGGIFPKLNLSVRSFVWRRYVDETFVFWEHDAETLETYDHMKMTHTNKNLF